MITQEQMQDIEVELKRKIVHVQSHMNERHLADIRVGSRTQFMGRIGKGLVAELRVHLWGNKTCETVRDREEVPLTWWQHFKQRWFPRWAIRRWPVRTRSITTLVEHWNVCPHIEVPKTQDNCMRFLAGTR